MTPNLFTGIPEHLPDELTEALVDTGGVRIERIVSRGHASPEGFWYDQEEAEWVILLRGKARLRFASGEVIELAPGDHVLLPAHQRHRVDWTDPAQDTLWLAVHFPDPAAKRKGTAGDSQRSGDVPVPAS